MEEDLEHHDDIYSFPLFSRKANSTHAASTGRVYQTINLRSPTPPDASPDLSVQQRPMTYYFTGIPTREIIEQYQQTAVTGEEIMNYTQTKWPGCQLSWRVTNIDATRPTKPSMTPHLEEGSASKKKRSGKKRRMIIRAEFLEKESKILAAKQALADKDNAWKENRARKNRNNKLRWRAKDRLRIA